MTCQQIQENLTLFLYGEVEFDQEAAIEQHLESCPLCRAQEKQLSLLHREMSQLQLAPSLDLLSQSRQRLRSEIAALRLQRSQQWYRRWLPEWMWGSGMGQPWQAAAAMGLAIMGFAGGYLVSAKNAGPVETASKQAEANRPVDASSGWTKRINSIQPVGDDEVEVAWEEVRPRVARGRSDQSEIQGLLVAAAGEAQQDPGIRIESVEILKDRGDNQKIRRTLLEAAQKDPSEAVRLRAVEALRHFYSYGEVRTALNQVLLRDSSANVRTLAIDVLVNQSGKDLDLAGVLQEVMRQERNPYIRERSQGALKAMNASLDTF